MLTDEGGESHVEATELLGLQHRLFPGVGHSSRDRRHEGEERNVPQHSSRVRWLEPLLGVCDDRKVRVSTTEAMARTEQISRSVDPLRMSVFAEAWATPVRRAEVRPIGSLGPVRLLQSSSIWGHLQDHEGATVAGPLTTTINSCSAISPAWNVGREDRVSHARSSRRSATLHSTGDDGWVGPPLAYHCRVQAQAQWLLVERLAFARAQRDQLSDASKREQLTHFRGVLEGFRYMGAMTAEEESVWSDKMLLALEITPPNPALPGILQADVVSDTSASQLTPPAGPISTHKAGPRFIRAAPAPDEEFEYRGSALRVVGVEQYDAVVAVKWIVNPEPNVWDVFPEESAALEQDLQDLDDGPTNILRKTAERLLRTRRLYVFALADDLGTRYEPTEEQHGAAFVSNGITRQSIGITGSAIFHPSVPSNARSLNFKWFALTLEVPLAWSPDPTFRPR